MDKLYPPRDLDSSKYRRVNNGSVDGAEEMLGLSLFCNSSSRADACELRNAPGRLAYDTKISMTGSSDSNVENLKSGISKAVEPRSGMCTPAFRR